MPSHAIGLPGTHHGLLVSTMANLAEDAASAHLEQAHHLSRDLT